MAKTDSGGIQCPKEFYEFILHRFDRLDEEMGDLAKSVETLNLQMAESVARRDATQKLVSRMAWCDCKACSGHCWV